MIRSAVAGNVELVELNLVQRQLIFTLAGTVLMLVVAAIDYRLWASIQQTDVRGHDYPGSRRLQSSALPYMALPDGLIPV